MLSLKTTIFSHENVFIEYLFRLYSVKYLRVWRKINFWFYYSNYGSSQWDGFFLNLLKNLFIIERDVLFNPWLSHWNVQNRNNHLYYSRPWHVFYLRFSENLFLLIQQISENYKLHNYANFTSNRLFSSSSFYLIGNQPIILYVSETMKFVL